MVRKATRYWAYAHDNTEEDDDITADLGDFDDLNPAITKACDYISLLVTDDMMTHTVRIVDSVLNSSTVWLAGPTKTYEAYVKAQAEANEEDDDN